MYIALGEVNKLVWWTQNQEAWLSDWAQHQLTVTFGNLFPFIGLLFAYLSHEGVVAPKWLLTLIRTLLCQNCLREFLKSQFLGPTSRDSDLVSLG